MPGGLNYDATLRPSNPHCFEEECAMSEPNPYQAPAAPLAGASLPVADPSAAVASRAGGAGRGWDWIAEGFELFKKAPGIWIVVVIVFFVCSILIAMVPVIG